jgi:hypothetical protein
LPEVAVLNQKEEIFLVKSNLCKTGAKEAET